MRPYIMCCMIGVCRTAGGECELGALGRSQDPRRAGARVLDTAEGVLIALRGCSLNQAFVEIVRTAKAHNVSTLSLADALVALAQDQAPQDGEGAAFVAARAAWGQPCRPDPAGPRRAIGSRRRRRCRRLEQGGVGVAVVVGQRHDDGLVDHIGRVGVTLNQVGGVAGIQSGVLDADVAGWCCSTASAAGTSSASGMSLR